MMWTELIAALLVTLVGQCIGEDLVQTLVNDPKETTLVQLVTKAGLAPALTSANFTIFAPTDEAFALLPQTLTDALNSDNTALQNALKYHVVPGNALSADLRNEEPLITLSGQALRINIYSHNHVVTAEGIKIQEVDRPADNGVIHVVSDVILPPTGTIVDIVANDPNFSTLLKAVQTVPGMADALKAEPLTVFAPSNRAFERMRDSELEALLQHPDKLKEVLTYHVIDHTLYSAGLYDREYPHSIDSHHDRLSIRIQSSGVTINSFAHVTRKDISATNGVVHELDHVLIPRDVYNWLRSGVIG